QFFSRAYDFGFSKTLEDTWAHWPKDSVLKDVVRIVRRFRPQVIVSVFSGTPRDGHGQHQAAGWAAQEAYRVAGDPNRFPELKTEEGLDPWTPTKLYIEAWFNPTAATLTLDAGEVEKISGKTYHQLAMAARSLHRSQDMGQIQDFGPSLSRLTFGAVRGGTADVGEGWGAFWSGVDTVLKAPVGYFEALTRAKAGAGRDRAAVAAALLDAQRNLPSDPSARDRIPSSIREHLTAARGIASWVFVDAVAERARVALGDSVRLTAPIRNAGTAPMALATAHALARGAGNGEMMFLDPIASGVAKEGEVVAAINPSVGATTPYYLTRGRAGDLYDWSSTAARNRGMPREDPEFTVLVADGSPGDRLELRRQFSARVRDQAFGEVRQPLVVVPRVSVKLTPGVAVVRTGATGESRTVNADIELESGLTTPVGGTVTIEVPNGWPRPTPVPFQLGGIGAQTHITIRVNVPAGVADGQYPIRAVATDAAGQRYDIGAFTVDYPHIRPRQYTKPATARIEVIDLQPPQARNVAYVRGAADKVPEALAAAGLHVTLLDSIALSTSDLSTYDAIVIGPRAYEVDSAVVRNNDRLNDYARNGG
ncbi:MAG TPA: NEW3 domain-containing protein, partial [Gemmatimonadales bacterium]|nr:NEW3 domain-containing protein [Gemmatimonadales bacterium]